MNERKFIEWLWSELDTAQYALLSSYERRDKFKYIDGPRLEKEYMEKIGNFEETVIKQEIECELLKKKQQMIQAAINRREPIDMEAIDAEIDKLRQQKYKESEGTAPQEFAELSAEASDELQQLYRDIVKNFHPQVHTELTEIQRQLFQKALEAYRCRDLEALRLIYDMLYGMSDKGIETSVENRDNKDEEKTREYVTDYKLAAVIYKGFLSIDEEVAIQDELIRYKQLEEETMEEIDRIRSKFPYNTVDMLSDNMRIEEYREELEHRLRVAKAECERRTREIQSMVGGVTAHG